MNLINYIDEKNINIEILDFLNVISNKELFMKKKLHKTLNVNLYPMLHNQSEKDILLFLKELKGFLTLKNFSILFDNYKNYQYYYLLKDNNFFNKEELNALNYYINKKSKSNFYFLTNMKKELLYFYTCSTNDVIKFENETNGNVFINDQKIGNNNLILDPNNQFLTTLFSNFLEFVKRDDEDLSFFYSFLKMHFSKNIERKEDKKNDLFKYDTLYFLTNKTIDKGVFDVLYKSHKSFFLINFFCLRGNHNCLWEEIINPFHVFSDDIFDFHFISLEKHILNPNIFNILKIFIKEYNTKNIFRSNKVLKKYILEKQIDYFFFYLNSSFSNYLNIFIIKAKKELSVDEFNTFIYSFSTFYTVLDFLYFKIEDVINFFSLLDENHIEILKNNIVLFDDFYSLYKSNKIFEFKNKYQGKYFSTFKWSKDLYQKLIQFNPIFKYFKSEIINKNAYESYNFTLLFGLINEKDNSFSMLKNELKLPDELNELFYLKNKTYQNDFSLLKENIFQKEILVYLNIIDNIDNIDIYFPLFDYFIQHDKKIYFINLNIDLFISIRKHLSINDFNFENLLFSSIDSFYLQNIKNINLNILEKDLDLLKKLKFDKNGLLTSSSKKIILMKYSK